MATKYTDCECDSSGEDTLGSPGSPPSTPSDLLLADTPNVGGSSSSKTVQKVGVIRREHSSEQKRVMRRESKKRKRKMRAATKKVDEIQKQKDVAVGHSQDAVLYKEMARHYGDRWHWEVQKRREATTRKKRKILNTGLHEIDPSFLENPTKDGKSVDVYLGTGSFSIVQLKVYRGVSVAVKQFRTSTDKEDVRNEAMILSRLCHPCLPYLFGVCTKNTPYKLVLQFHGINLQTVTLSKEICEKKVILCSKTWLILLYQLIEGVHYIHSDAEILHNDIKPNNILLAEDDSATTCRYQVVLSDFGKATPLSHGRVYKLSNSEKVQYLKRYPHISPEVVHGERMQTTFSDIFSLGVLLRKLIDYHCFTSLPTSLKNDLASFSAKCQSVHYTSRPSAKQCLETIEDIIKRQC